MTRTEAAVQARFSARPFRAHDLIALDASHAPREDKYGIRIERCLAQTFPQFRMRITRGTDGVEDETNRTALAIIDGLPSPLGGPGGKIGRSGFGHWLQLKVLTTQTAQSRLYALQHPRFSVLVL